MSKRGRRVGWASAALLVIGPALLFPGPGCGAKSGLKTKLRDAGPGIEAAADVPVPPPCGEFSIRGSLAPLDVFLTMDTSGSMDDFAASGERKLDAVREALAAFLRAPESAGIGVSLSFFPIPNPGVPSWCATGTNGCGDPDACASVSLCYPSALDSSIDVIACISDDECPAGNTCEQMGICGTNTAVPGLCFPGGLYDCSTGVACYAAGLCQNTVKCEPVDYQPTREPEVLPDGAASLISTLNIQSAEGGTPTLPALQGAIQAALDRTQTVPDHKSIVLLATDGFPTSCDPDIPISDQASSEGIPKLVDAAGAGRDRGVETFVIGVFAEPEAAVAQQNLDTIAEAGGSTRSYIVSTDQPVAQEFLSSLNAIRAAAAECEYALPRPGDVPLDGPRIEVWLVSASGEERRLEPFYSGGCRPGASGFVFDRDPFGQTPPTRVQLCPLSCAEVRSDPTLDIEVRVACPR